MMHDNIDSYNDPLLGNNAGMWVPDIFLFQPCAHGMVIPMRQLFVIIN